MKLDWDKSSERLFETGVSKGVLYLLDSAGKYTNGVAWNGLTSVSEAPSGAEASPIYADNQKYLNLYSAEEFAATIGAYMYPDEFGQCDGTAEPEDGILIGQQDRKMFGFCYETLVGNDTEDTKHGKKIHCFYGCKAAPSQKDYATVNDSPEAMELSWEISTVPVNVTGYKPVSSLVIDSTKCDADKLKEFEKIIYGFTAPAFSEEETYALGDYVTYSEKTYKCTTAVTSAGAWSEANWTETTDDVPRLPLPDEIISFFGTEG